MKPFPRFIETIVLVGIVLLFSCKKEYSCENGCGANEPPEANAGGDTTIVLPINSVILDGSNSKDPNNNIVSFLWTKISGPANFDIANANSAITAVDNLAFGSYYFELLVTDSGGLSSTDTVTIRVDSIYTDHTPIANAGADQTITWPITSVDLDGSGSSDPDNDISTYTWTKISGAATFSLVNPNSMQTRVTKLEPGVYQFELKVKDVTGLSSTDTVQITVFSISNTTCNMNNRSIIDARLIQVGTLSEGRFGIVAGAAGNKILFAGGITAGPYSNRVDIYDIVANTWSTSALSEGREGMTVASVGNKIFFAGGGNRNAGTVTSRVDIYDASTGSWSTAELSESRSQLTSATLGNKIFFAGGGTWNMNYFSSSARVDIFDNSTNTWSTASLSEARSGLSAVSVGSKIYFAGGSNSSDAFSISNKIDIYDGATNSWTTSNLKEGKMFMGNVAVGNKVCWAGGINIPQAAGYTESDQVEIRDVNTQTSTFACIFPKSQFSAVRTVNKIVFFTGFQGYPNQFDIYDAGSDVWSIGVLDKRINGAAIISVRDVIYVAGGTLNGTGYSNQVWKLQF